MLKDFIKKNNYYILSYANIDEIFIRLNKQNIKEIKVDLGEMALITSYYCNITHSTEIKEGKIDKFLGIKLILI